MSRSYHQRGVESSFTENEIEKSLTVTATLSTTDSLLTLTNTSLWHCHRRTQQTASSDDSLFCSFFSSDLFHTHTLTVTHQWQLCPLVYQKGKSKGLDWIGLSSVLRPHQHSIGYMGDGFYRSKDPTNSIKVLKEQHFSTNSIKQLLIILILLLFWLLSDTYTKGHDHLFCHSMVPATDNSDDSAHYCSIHIIKCV